ncbi:hypothetical protein [Aeromonas sp. BIGb0445]|uniref:hypothetical protein n=1 Tax=Aeromonas sp. BIGb0445 TaxID=2940593 RepID=UPI002168C0C5|nr:hypothetical protein [Aeromonas sp. BIGb0445]MCS3460695.1 hypothetical protein [Aeromonas sp. BIGb0445]
MPEASRPGTSLRADTTLGNIQAIESQGRSDNEVDASARIASGRRAPLFLISSADL